MGLTLEQKKSIVAEVVSDLKETSAVYLLNFEKIPVEADNALRKVLNEKGIKYRVVKNTLLGRAFKETGVNGFESLLNGCSAILLGDSESPMLPAKEIVQFHKDNPDLLPVKGIDFDGQFYEGERVKEIAKMPGRQELIAQIVSITLGPGANLVALLNGPGSTIAGQLKALEDKLENA